MDARYLQKRQAIKRAQEKSKIKEWSDANFAVKPKCKRCGVEIGFGQANVSISDHHHPLCQSCVELGISLEKLDDPMKGNPLRDW